LYFKYFLNHCWVLTATLPSCDVYLHNRKSKVAWCWPLHPLCTMAMETGMLWLIPASLDLVAQSGTSTFYCIVSLIFEPFFVITVLVMMYQLCVVEICRASSITKRDIFQKVLSSCCRNQGRWVMWVEWYSAFFVSLTFLITQFCTCDNSFDGLEFTAKFIDFCQIRRGPIF